MDSLFFDFNSYEKQLLKKYLDFYVSLDKGKLIATTEAQKHFVSVCNSFNKGDDAIKPIMDHERVYLKYKRTQLRNKLMEKGQLKREKFYERIKDNKHIPEHEEGTPMPGWFTRDD